MDELNVPVDPGTAAHIVAFAESINVTPEEAAARILRIAVMVRRVLESKGLLAGGSDGNYLVSFGRKPDGSRSFDITAAP
jgi:hypothetical protein